MAYPFTPDYKVVANGGDITEAVKTRLVSITVVDETGIKSDSFDIEIDNRNNGLAAPPFGADVEIWLGYKETGLTKMGRYRYDELGIGIAPWTLTIRGRATDTNASTSMPLIKARATGSWVDKTIKEIAQEIANKHKLILKCNEEIGEQDAPFDQQTGQSDIDYLKLLVQNYGGTVKASNGYLLIYKTASGVRPATSAAASSAMPVFALTPADVTGVKGLLTRRSSHNAVRATWVDTGGDEHDEIETDSDPEDEISETQVDGRFPDADSARGAARAKLDQLTRDQDSVSVTLPGNPAICAESKISLFGFHDLLDRTWVVVKATHKLNERGFTTELEAVKDLSAD